VREQIRLHPRARPRRSRAIAFELFSRELVSVEDGMSMMRHGGELTRGIVSSVIRLAVQSALERGIEPNPVSILLARVWAARARVTKSLTVRKPVLCVSGATLGGSGRTPLAIACARFLADGGLAPPERREGLRVALVGHGYGARLPRRARRVAGDDDPRVCGDEAIECARAGLTVFVARSRQDAIVAAEACADALVLDGPLQLEPRATLSLLAVDPIAPWGSGACPPLGNLRAPKETLLAHADAVVAALPASRGVHLNGELIRFDALRGKRFGLTTSIARPERVLAFLRAKGLEPCRVLQNADHAALRTNDSAELWLTTAKDAARTPPQKHAKVAVIDYYLDLPKDVASLLQSRFFLRF
jgi:tetraacyldisaccharide 4'-kinase